MSHIPPSNPAASLSERDRETITDRIAARQENRTNRLFRAAAMCLAALPWGIVLFTLLVTGVALGGGLMITFVGVPILAWTLHLARLGARIEHRIMWGSANARRRAPEWPRGPRTWAEYWSLIRDPAAWNNVIRGLTRLPLGILSFTITIVLSATAVTYMTAPLIYRWAGIWTVTGEVETLGQALLAVPQGLVVAAVAAYVIPGMASRLAPSAHPW